MDDELVRGLLKEQHPDLAELPLRFEENRGQFDPAVRYAARSGGYSLQLSAEGAALATAGGRVQMSLVNSNPAAKIEALRKL